MLRKSRKKAGDDKELGVLLPPMRIAPSLLRHRGLAEVSREGLTDVDRNDGKGKMVARLADHPQGPVITPASSFTRPRRLQSHSALCRNAADGKVARLSEHCSTATYIFRACLTTQAKAALA